MSLRLSKAFAFAALVLGAPTLGAACAGAPPQPAPTAAPVPAPLPVAVVAPAPSAVASAAPTTPPPKPEADKPLACPAEMVLVDGDYCTDVELKCKPGRSHYAKQNKKTICE